MGSFILLALLLFILVAAIATGIGFKLDVTEKVHAQLNSSMASYDEVEVAQAKARKALLVKCYGIASGVYAVLLLLAVFVLSLSSVPASNVGVVTLFGEVQPTTIPEGLHIINPLAKVSYVFVGLDTAQAQNAEAASRDMQTVHTTLTVNYNVDAKGARDLYVMNPSLTYENQYVVPAIYEVFKSVTSMYTAEELITKRTEASHVIRDQLSKKLAAYHLIVQDINVTNFAFSKSFNDAIEAKVRASQEAEKAQRDLARVKFEAEQNIVTAKAQAETIRIQADAVRAQGGKEFVQLEAIKKWDGALPKFVGGSTPMPFINLDTKDSK
jgi:regulator of protease activity HflC (stomatin/prohibitin superfamily)